MRHFTARAGKPCYTGVLGAKRAARHRPGSHSSRHKRAGFAAHDRIIADGPEKRKGARRAHRALNRAEINGAPLKRAVLGASITAIGAGGGVTRR